MCTTTIHSRHNNYPHWQHNQRCLQKLVVHCAVPRAVLPNKHTDHARMLYGIGEQTAGVHAIDVTQNEVLYSDLPDL